MTLSLPPLPVQTPNQAKQVTKIQTFNQPFPFCILTLLLPPLTSMLLLTYYIKLSRSCWLPASAALTHFPYFDVSPLYFTG